MPEGRSSALRPNTFALKNSPEIVDEGGAL